MFPGPKEEVVPKGSLIRFQRDLILANRRVKNCSGNSSEMGPTVDAQIGQKEKHREHGHDAFHLLEAIMHAVDVSRTHRFRMVGNSNQKERSFTFQEP